MASSSSSSSHYTRKSYRCISYDVFLSFRGADTRLGFTDHLYNALEDAGFITFRDNEELPRGEPIDSELYKAIHDSKCSVVVLSKDYGSSESCLFELETILERRRTSDHIVIPVFYQVDPNDVWDQSGCYKHAFDSHEERFKNDIAGKVDRWRAALKEASELAGMNLENLADKHEARFIKKIITEVENKLRPITLSITHDLVGVDSQLESINLWLEDGSTDVGILFICGIPGIGKTTIAKSVYNSNFNRFEGCAFLENISENSGQVNGLVNLQTKLLSILTKRDIRINTVSEGTKRITDTIRFRRVILVLDDVDHIDQLDAIIGWRNLFCAGSKIIITTRQNTQLLKAREVYKVHVVKSLDADDSLKLFSRHAFEQDKPIEHYEKVSKNIVDHCEGLPLALKILGSTSLSWKSIEYWESAIKKLKDIPNGEILRKLKLSYDACDDHDQNVFLDIACFFIGQDKDFMVTILYGCNFEAKIGIHNLENKYLITIDEDNQVRMHNLLRDMGRDIVRQESPKEPGERSRLWKDLDSYNVLMKRTGKKTIEGMVLNRSNIPSITSNKGVLETTAFEKMAKLKLLILTQVQLTGSYESFPKDLRWLSWGMFPLASIPNDFPLESLVALDMHYSCLRQVWEVSKCLPLLKILNLSHSFYLTQTPDFSLLPGLERLILNDCASLITVHESISTLELLVTLDISGCSSLIKFPLSELSAIKSLKVFRADGTPMNRLLNNSIEMIKPIANPWPQYVVEVSLVNCNLSDDDFPWDFSNLSSLQLLNLSGNHISRLPDCIKNLTGLNQLSLWNCKRLQSVLGLPRIKEQLNVTQCHSLEKVTFKSVTCKPHFIGFTYFQTLVEFQYWFKLEPIGSVDIEMINILGLRNLESLQDIYINITSFIWAETKRLPIQGIHEHGIFNIFFQGNEISGCFSHKNRDSATTISFILPIVPVKIQGLNLSILYVVEKILDHSPTFGHMTIQIENNSKGLNWIYRPTFFGYVDFGKDMIWLSHWKFGDQLEGGDEVIVSIFVDHESDAIKFKECGVEVVYEQREKMNTKENATRPSDVGGGNICEYWRDYYEVRPGTYFLMGGPSSYSFRDILWRLWEDFNDKLKKEATKNCNDNGGQEISNKEGVQERYIEEKGGLGETPRRKIQPVRPISPSPQYPPRKTIGGPLRIAPPPTSPMDSGVVPMPPKESFAAVDDDFKLQSSHHSSLRGRRAFMFLVFFIFLFFFSYFYLGMLLGYFTKISKSGICRGNQLVGLRNRQTDIVPT